MSNYRAGSPGREVADTDDYIQSLSPRYRVGANRPADRRVLPDTFYDRVPTTRASSMQIAVTEESDVDFSDTETSEDMMQCSLCQDLVYEYEFDEVEKLCETCLQHICQQSGCSSYVDETDQNALCEYCSVVLCDECRRGHSRECQMNPYKICKVKAALRLTIS